MKVVAKIAMNFRENARLTTTATEQTDDVSIF